jgi:hypothetical protein
MSDSHFHECVEPSCQLKDLTDSLALVSAQLAQERAAREKAEALLASEQHEVAMSWKDHLDGLLIAIEDERDALAARVASLEATFQERADNQFKALTAAESRVRVLTEALETLHHYASELSGLVLLSENGHFKDYVTRRREEVFGKSDAALAAEPVKAPATPQVTVTARGPVVIDESTGLEDWSEGQLTCLDPSAAVKPPEEPRSEEIKRAIETTAARLDRALHAGHRGSTDDCPICVPSTPSPSDPEGEEMP